mmetsp:Transcript_26414/g.26664  ORF Transcript_26414/g.26664 Transcript_26414/m.26664 type:complete len:150 (+) Transcript_26414:120-569(+)
MLTFMEGMKMFVPGQKKSRKIEYSKERQERHESRSAPVKPESNRVQAFNDNDDDDEEDDAEYQPGEKKLFQKSAKGADKLANTGPNPSPAVHDPSVEWLKQEANKLKSQGVTKKPAHASTIYQPQAPKMTGNRNDMIVSDFDIPISRTI